MDVIKTRLQTAAVCPDGRPPSLSSIVRDLVASEGVGWVSRGLVARLLNSAPVSMLMILSYELTKRWSIKEEYRHLL